MKNNMLIAFITVLVIIIPLGCASAIRYDGPYEGRVIDADTGDPIEGVVVLGVWNKEHITPGGGVSEYYDARETVTDENGEFSVPGQGLLIVSNVTPMDVLIFKAGYEYIGMMTWKELKRTFKTEDGKVIIRLKKLTMEERKRQGAPDFYIGERYDKKENITHSCLPKNIKILPKEVNKELLEQGRKPYDLEGGRCEK